MRNFRTILLSMLLLVPLSMFAQQTINGKVVDKTSGIELPGVNVIIKGTKKGTVTDFNGKFSLSEVKSGEVLVISYVGYTATEVAVTNNQNYTITISESTQALEEVVIIGYGQVRKKDATGSVTTVGADDLNKGPIVSPQQLLTGKSAGVQITSGGGSPGANSTIRIRGGSSLIATNDPLIVIDGIPVGNDGVSGLSNPLSVVNPSDIDSFTILKDASATAIYGSRASNGVIIITTKKGKATDGLKVNYNGNLTVGSVVKKVDVLEANDYRRLIIDKGSLDQLKLIGGYDTDWQDEIYQTAIGTDHNVTMNGSEGGINYRTSVGYSNQNGILLTDNLQRTSYAVSLNKLFFDDHLKIDLNSKTAVIKNRFANNGAIGSAVAMDPTQPVRIDNQLYGGYFQWLQANNLPIAIGATKNPVALLEQQIDKSSVTRTIANIQLDYKFHFLPDLRANLNLGLDKSQSYGSNLVSDKSANTVLTNGTNLGNYREYGQKREDKLLDFYLNYVKEIKSINTKVDVMGGYSYQDFSGNGYNKNDLQNPTIAQENTYLIDPENLQSYFGRVNLTFAQKYLLTLTYRTDGTSRFYYSGESWGKFPSAAFAWKVSEENFLVGSSVISDLKMRLGWGITGQQAIPVAFPALPLYNISTNTAQYQLGNTFYNTARPEPYNELIKWEETTTYNAGVDFGLFTNKLNGTVDVYYRETKDLLNFIPYPGGSNLSNAGYANVGNLVNKGIEFTLDATPVQTNNLKWNVGINFTYNDSEITKLTLNESSTYEGIETGGIQGGVGNTVQRHSVGYTPSTFFLYQQVYNADGTPAEGVYVDRNKDGVITNADKYRSEKPAADYFFGFNTSLNYKNFDFSMAWRGSIGNFMYNNVDSDRGYLLNTTRYENVINNSVQNVLESGFIDGGTNRYLSDYYLQDASFLKLDNITLGYTFNKSFKGVKNMKVFGSAQNVLTITKYDGLDPEIFGGIDSNIYPRPRTYMLGVNLDF
ncbi:MAG TPA: TonB-dependent receptor [Flavobacteriaceae bacterium]|nr:TonB-dependent receptor [Flavobacteriaceae bacterium]